MIHGIILQATQVATDTANVISQVGAKQYDELSIWQLTLKGGWMMVPFIYHVYFSSLYCNRTFLNHK